MTESSGYSRRPRSMMKPKVLFAFVLTFSVSCLPTYPTVPAPSGEGWDLESQGYRRSVRTSTSTTTSKPTYGHSHGSTGGYRYGQQGTTTTTTTHSSHVEGHANLSDKSSVSSDDIRRSLRVGANVRDFEFNRELHERGDNQ